MNRILISLRVYNLNNFLLRMIDKGITIIQVSYTNKYLKCYIDKKDLPYLKKYYHLEIIKDNKIIRIRNILRNNILLISSIILSIILFLIFKNIIIKVEVVSKNDKLTKNLLKTLETYNVKRLTFALSDEKLINIKNKILSTYQNEIEWLEIKREGMLYVITLEERLQDTKEKEKDYCNVYAKRDGYVKIIEATHGNVLVHEDTLVRSGDLLISGDITLNGEEKSTVCASGKIYGEVWYKASLSLPTYYEVKKRTGRSQTNFKLDMGRNDYKILRSKYPLYEEEDQVLISILGKRLIKSKEYELETEKISYTEEELDSKINALVAEKINLQLDDEEKILHKNILKKNTFDSTIEVEVFITALVLLSS